MIALLLAATVAASTPRLSVDELRRAIDQEISAESAQLQSSSEAVQNLRAEANFTWTVRRFEAQTACQDEGTLLNAAKKLQRVVDEKSIDLVDPALIQRVGGSGLTIYPLTGDEVGLVQTKLHELEFEARQKAVTCGA